MTDTRDEAVEPQPGTGAAATAGGSTAIATPPETRLNRFGGLGLALLFLLPAVAFLGLLVAYPTVYTFIRSLFSNSETHPSFVWFRNYGDMFTSHATLISIKNNAIWVVAAPSIVTALGLIFAVLTERIRWSTAFKFIVFMPMAIGFLASGVIFRLVYQQDPSQGLANAVVVGIHDTFAGASHYPKALPRPGIDAKQKGAIVLGKPVKAGSTALLPLVGLLDTDIPKSAVNAHSPASAPGNAIAGAVWVDFKRGGGGKLGAIDPGEKGLPHVKVQALAGGKVKGSASTASDGSFTINGLQPGTSYQLRLAASNFGQPYRGVTWLGPAIATPAIIGAYIWMWAGFAMVLIAAGLSAIPRDALEAARVDGAKEWQVFRRVTVPLLSPVLVVVLVTLIINVLKIFDLVFIIAPDSVQDDANVLALQMWRVAFGGQPLLGLGSAIAIFMFLLVVPAMLFNLRRFRSEQR